MDTDFPEEGDEVGMGMDEMDMDFPEEGEEPNFEEGDFGVDEEPMDEEPMDEEPMDDGKSELDQISGLFMDLENQENPTVASEQKMQPQRTAAKRNPQRLSRVKKAANNSQVDEIAMLSAGFMGVEENNHIQTRDYFTR